MKNIISMDEVVTNLTMYTVGMRRLGELPCSDGVYDPDAPDMSMVHEHESTSTVGIVEDIPTVQLQEHSSITGNRIVWQWPIGIRTQHKKSTRTVLAVRDAYVNGIHYSNIYIKQ